MRLLINLQDTRLLRRYHVMFAQKGHVLLERSVSMEYHLQASGEEFQDKHFRFPYLVDAT